MELDVIKLGQEGIEHFTSLVQQNRTRKLIPIPNDIAEKLALGKGRRVHIFIKVDDSSALADKSKNRRKA